jgi:hypothetical protein
MSQYNILKTVFSSLYFWYGLVQSEVQKYWAPGCLKDYVLFSGIMAMRLPPQHSLATTALWILYITQWGQPVTPPIHIIPSPQPNWNPFCFWNIVLWLHVIIWYMISDIITRELSWVHATNYCKWDLVINYKTQCILYSYFITSRVQPDDGQ